MSHLKPISERTKADRHAVIIVDGASWHQEHLTGDSPKITLICLSAPVFGD